MTVAACVDPVRLAAYAFGHTYWSLQADLLRAIFRPHARVAVKGCHASGKTFAAADAILLALLLGGDAVTTAPTDDQVRGQLWRQVNATVREGRIPAAEWGHVAQTEIRLPTGERAFGRSTNMGVRFHGEHARAGRFLLVIVDEAPGVIADVLAAIEGMRAGGDVRVLIQGNPLAAAGPFYAAFYPPDGGVSGWDTHTIDAFDTPNLAGLSLEQLLALPAAELDADPLPELITRRYVVEKYREWGAEHWKWQARVRGQFPTQAPDALFSFAWLETAAARPRTRVAGLPLQAGVDVAGPGEDETVLTLVQAGTILHQEDWALADPRGVLVAALRPYADALELINVDSVGIGWGIYLHLRDEFGDKARPVNVGESPTNRQRKDAVKFKDLKAELYWNARDWLREGMVGGLERRAVSQLASIRYTHDHQGRVEIERKDEAVKRGIKSPDWAESTVLALWRDPRIARQRTYGQRVPLRRVGRR